VFGNNVPVEDLICFPSANKNNVHPSVLFCFVYEEVQLNTMFNNNKTILPQDLSTAFSPFLHIHPTGFDFIFNCPVVGTF